MKLFGPRVARPRRNIPSDQQGSSLGATAVRRASAAAAPCIEPLEGRRLMAGDPAILQTLPFSLDFSAPRVGINDRDGDGTGFTWVQPTRTNDEYHPDLINLRPADGVLDLTTFGSSTIGSHWEGDNTLANALQVQFNGSAGVYTISAHLKGPLGFIDRPNEQAGIIFGPDQDNFIKLVALGQTSGSVIQFTDESPKATGGYTHTLSSTASLTSVGSFGAVTSLDLMISADAGTGKISAYYSVNDGPVAKVVKEITLSGARKTTFFSTAARAGIMAAHKNDIGPITATFDDFSIASGAPVITRPSVTATRPADGATNFSRDGFVAADVFLPNPGKGVDAATLTSDSVKLLRASDGAVVDAHVNTSGGGDSIVLQPSGPLDPNTKYTFEVTDAVKDTGGNAFAPFTSSFTTGTAVNATNPTIAFEKIELASAQGANFTGLTVGPDGRLYTGTDTGLIERFNINADGTLGAPQIITSVVDGNAGSERLLTGIRFDPSSTSGNLILWVTHGQVGVEGADDWTGKVSRLSGPNLENYQDYVTGLPRSIRDHLTNQIDFGPDGGLYFSQASTTAMGAPDNAWGLRNEHLLSGAILRLDLPMMAQRFAQGSGALNAKTEEGGTYNPFASNAPLTLYATGVRNAYDLVWASNGRLYAPTNGSASGGSTPGYPNTVFASQRIDQAINGPYPGTIVPALVNVKETEDDFLFDVQKGAYYGHPNPTRGEYVLDGGNPTAGVDFEEFTQYPVGTQPDRNYQHPAFVFGKSYSPDGIIEYHGNAFGGALDHALLVTRYSGGDDVVVLHPAADGTIDSMQSGIAGLTHFVDPLDLTEDNCTGFLYVSEYGGQKITLMRPITPGARLSADHDKMVFNDPLGGIASPPELLTITNSGSTPLAIPSDGLSILGADANAFSIVSSPGLPMTVPPGQSITIGISFAPAAGSSMTIRQASLQIKSNDASKTVTTISLRGLPTTGTGGANEPSLQHLLDLYQLPIKVGDSNPDSTNLFSNDEPLTSATDEVPMQRLYKASQGPVTIEPLAVFGVSSSPALRFGWYSGGTSGDKTQLFTVPTVDAQSVSPTVSGVTSFDPGDASFGFYSVWPGFGNREVFTEDAFNTQELTPANQHKVRFYPLKNADGSVVPNAYVMAHEEFVNDPTGAYDNQDIVAIIRNVRPAGGAEIGLESVDGLPFPDRLVFNRIEKQPPDAKTDPITGFVTQPPDNVVHDQSTVRVRNTGGGPLTITSMVLSSPAWAIDSPAAGQRVIPAGGFLNVTVRFVAHNIPPGQTENQTVGAAANTGGLWSGTLTINSDDSDEPATSVALAGWWQSHSEFNQEPTLPILVNRMFGFGTSILGAGETLNGAGQVQSVGEEVLSPFWVRANSTASVSVRQLDAFHTQGNTETIRTFLKGSTQSALLFTHDGVEGQSLLPHDLEGNPAMGTLAAAQASGTFGFRVQSSYSDDTRNTQQQPGGGYGHNLRFYPARDASGNLIPDAWIIAQDYYATDPVTGEINSNYDYQDNLYLVTNIRPATPATPANVTAVANGNGINLDWTDSPEHTVVGYNIYRSKSAGGTYTKLNATPLAASVFMDATAPTGATSYYRIAAADDWGGESGKSAVVSATRQSDVTPPAAPSALAAAGEIGGIRLSWIPSVDADVVGYFIYRAPVDGTFMLLNPGAPTAATSFLDASAATEREWFYRIAAVDGSGNLSPISDPASAVRPVDSDHTAPAAPTSAVATGQGEGIKISWSASPELDAAGYRVYRASSSGGTYSIVSGNSLLAGTSFLDTTVAPGVTWFYRITASDGSGNESTPSAVVSDARIAVGGGGTGEPGTGLRGDYYDTVDFTGSPFSRADSAINFYWDTGSPDPAIDADTFSVRWTGQILAPTSEAYTFTARTDDGVRVWINNQLIIDRFQSGGGMIDASGTIDLVAGQKYDIRVDYFENTGRAGAKLYWQTPTIANDIIPTANLYTSPVVDSTPPEQVRHVSALPGAGKVDVSWTAVNDPSLAGYNVYRDTTGKKNFVKLNSSPLTGTTFTDTTAPVGVMRYQVVAVDAAGNASTPTGVTILKPGDNVFGRGLRADYFDNIDLTGKKLTRVDRSVNFYWDTGSPATMIAPDTFSVRWTGQIQAKSTEAYTFSTRTDDGARLWIDGKLVIDHWVTAGGLTDTTAAPISLVAGQRYDIRLEYFERTGRAGVKLYWQTDTIEKEIVPSLNLFTP